MAILVALSGGCSSPSLGVWSSAPLTGATADALTAWNTALAAHCPEVSLYAASRDTADVRIQLGDATGEHGAYHEGDKIVVDPGELPVDRVTGAIAHELGHALGIDEHSSDPGDLMFGEVRDGEGKHVPTDRDVARACEAAGYP